MLSSQWISTIGLGMDMIGAILVAYEVIRDFNGNKYREPTPQTEEEIRRLLRGEYNETGATDTMEFRRWQSRKRFVGGIGLAFLLAGFGLQAWANWV